MAALNAGQLYLPDAAAAAAVSCLDAFFVVAACVFGALAVAW